LGISTKQNKNQRGRLSRLGRESAPREIQVAFVRCCQRKKRAARKCSAAQKNKLRDKKEKEKEEREEKPLLFFFFKPKLQN
jgi:hypothetical protein